MIFQSSGMSMKKLCVNHCFVIDFIIPGICVHFVDFPLRKNKKVFGCDICQDICPHNKNIEVTNFPQFKENLMTKIDIDEINEISNKEFKRRYNNKAFSWRGRKLIKRNLDIIYEENKINL